MANKYQYTDIFDAQSFKKGFGKLETQLKEIDLLIKNIGKGNGSGQIKELNKALGTLNKQENKLKTVQKDRLKVQKQQKTQLQKINRENQKNLKNLRKIGDSLNKEKVFEKELLKLKQQRIRQEQKIRAQRELGIKQTQSFTSVMKSSVNGVKNFVRALAGLAIGFMALQRLKSAADKYIQSATDQIIVEQKLETILKERTGATKGQTKAIIKLAKEEQKRGVLGDEIQLAGAQQIATFVKTTKSVEKLMPAMNNLIAQQKGFNASQEDAVTIANLVGRAFQGQLGSLTRVGISFNEAQGKILKYGTESEKAAALAEIITQNVGEMNQTLAETDVGKMQQLNNELSDMEEEIGMKLIPIMVKWKGKIRDVLNELNDLNEFGKVTTKNQRDESNLFLEDLKKELELRDARARRIKIGQKLTEQQTRLQKLQNLENPFRSDVFSKDRIKWANWKLARDNEIITTERQIFLLKELRADQNFFNIEADKTSEIIDEVGDSFDDAGKSIEDADKNLKKLLDKLFQIESATIKEKPIIDTSGIKVGKVGGEGDIVSQVFGNIDKTAEQAAAELRNLIPKWRRDLNAYIKNVFDKDAGGTILGRMFGGGEDSEVIASQVRETWAQITSFLEQEIQRELDALDTLIDRQTDAIEKTQEQLDAEKNRINELKIDGEAFDTGEQQRLEAKLAREEDARKRSLAAEKAAKQKQKQLDLVQAVINTASSALKAFASAGNPILGAILAAIAVAFGAFQISKIKAAKYAKGTNYLELGGNPDGVDTIPILANKGERIVPTKDNSGIPRTFPNSLLPEAVNYFLDSKSKTPILDARSYTVWNKIEKNTRKEGKYYDSEGQLKRITDKYMNITYG
jgi:DNA repair exonuclease SbcCD ATPase subunit